MSRTLVWTIIAASAILIYAFGVAPLAEKRTELRDSLFMENKSLIKHEYFIKAGADAKEDLKNSNEALDRMERRLIQESDVSLAMASLQGRIQDLASEAGFTISSIKPLNHKDFDEGYRAVPIFIDGTGDMRQLSRFLAAIDTRDFMTVNRLVVTIAPMERLRVKIELSGLMKR